MMTTKTLKQVIALAICAVAVPMFAAEPATPATTDPAKQATVEPAKPTTVEDRLNQLEKSLKSLQKENADLKTQLGWDGKAPLVVAKPAGKESKLTIGGFLQANAEFGEEPDARWAGIENRFLLRRARVNVSGVFAENFDYKLESDFGANSLSEQTGYRAQLTDAYINWNRYSFANVKVGQFKTPFGYEQLMSDTKLLTIERSLPNDRLTDGRQIGLGVSGDFLNKRLGYSVGMFNGTGVNNSFNDNEQFMYAGRLTGVPVVVKLGKEELRWSVGVNALTTHDNAVTRAGFGFTPANAFTGRRDGFGVDTQLKWGIFGLEAEYLRNHFSPANNVPAANFVADGVSATVTAFVVPKYLRALVKYEVFDPSHLVANNTSEVWTFGLDYLIKGDDLKLSVNYLLGNPAGQPDGQGRLLTRFQLVF